MSISMSTAKKVSVVSCAVCDVDILLLNSDIKRLKETRGTFYCPKGHRLEIKQKAIEETCIEKLKEEIAALTDENLALKNAAALKYKKCPECGNPYVKLHNHLVAKHGIPRDDALRIAKSIPRGYTD